MACTETPQVETMLKQFFLQKNIHMGWEMSTLFCGIIVTFFRMLCSIFSNIIAAKSSL